MTRITTSDSTQLRERLVAVLASAPPDELDGSLYLNTLGCLYLAAEAGTSQESALEATYYHQAEVEDVDGDDLLTRLILCARAGEEAAHAES